MKSLEFKKDRHGGVIILENSLPLSVADFQKSLTESLESWKLQGFKLAWLTLSKEKLHLISTLVELGFTFHHALDTQATLVYHLIQDAFVPPYATHTSGAGAVVISPDNRILLVQENVRRNRYLYKLPGGLLEENEHIADAVIREVFEETGIKTSFESILGLGQVHGWQFDKSNIYFVCRLKPHSFDIQVDGVEIKSAIWMPLDEFFQSVIVGSFDKQIVAKTINVSGLKSITLDDVDISADKLEIFLP